MHCFITALSQLSTCMWGNNLRWEYIVIFMCRLASPPGCMRNGPQSWDLQQCAESTAKLIILNYSGMTAPHTQKTHLNKLGIQSISYSLTNFMIMKPWKFKMVCALALLLICLLAYKYSFTRFSFCPLIHLCDQSDMGHLTHDEQLSVGLDDYWLPLRVHAE